MPTALRRVTAALTTIAALLLLSGCLSMEGKLSLDSEARASGTLTVLLSKQFAAILGITSVDALSSAIEDAPEEESLPGGLLDGSGEVSVRETETDFAIDVTLTDAVLEEEDSIVARVNEAGDRVTFTYTNTSEDADTDGLDLTSGLGRVTLEVDFPGPVVEASGEGMEQLDADTVRWDFPLTTSTVATATSEIAPESSSTGVGVGVLAGVAAVAVAALVGIGLVVRRRSGQPAAAAEAAVMDADQPPYDVEEPPTPPEP